MMVDTVSDLKTTTDLLNQNNNNNNLVTVF